MPLSDVRSVHLPYCLERQQDGSHVVLNREYKPLGFKTRDHIDDAVKLRGLRVATAAKLSFNGSQNIKLICLYDDGCIPTRSAANMAAYMNRLAVLAKLKC